MLTCSVKALLISASAAAENCVEIRSKPKIKKCIRVVFKRVFCSPVTVLLERTGPLVPAVVDDGVDTAVGHG
jgi:hypothetical protein